MRPKVQAILDEIKESQRKLGLSPDNVYIVLGTDDIWLRELYNMADTDISIRTTSNKDDFKALLKSNPDATIVVALEGEERAGLMWAHSMGLLVADNEIIFAGHEKPSFNVHSQMKAVGSYFVEIAGNLWDNIKAAKDLRQAAA